MLFRSLSLYRRPDTNSRLCVKPFHPSYEIGTSRRLKDLKGLGLFKQLVDFMGVARRAVEDIRVGHTGFGEPNSGACKRMCGE